MQQLTADVWQLVRITCLACCNPRRYALLWTWTAFHLLASPSAHALYVCWVVGHAYATCRICVGAINGTGRLSFKWSYTVGTLLASSVTILVALPLVASVRLLVFYLGIPIMLGAVAAPFHVHYKVAESHSPFTYYRKAITRVA